MENVKNGYVVKEWRVSFGDFDKILIIEKEKGGGSWRLKSILRLILTHCMMSVWAWNKKACSINIHAVTGDLWLGGCMYAPMLWRAFYNVMYYLSNYSGNLVKIRACPMFSNIILYELTHQIAEEMYGGLFVPLSICRRSFFLG